MSKIDVATRLIGDNIKIGCNVRIDAFAVLTSSEEQQIVVGDNVHISAGAMLFGSVGGIELGDFVGVGARSIILSGTDDLVGGYMIGTQIPDEYRNVKTGKVIVDKHGFIGAGAIIMPGVKVGYGAVVGAMAFIRKDVPPFAIMVGHDHRIIGYRNKDLLLELDAKLAQSFGKLQS